MLNNFWLSRKRDKDLLKYSALIAARNSITEKTLWSLSDSDKDVLLKEFLDHFDKVAKKLHGKGTV